MGRLPRSNNLDKELTCPFDDEAWLEGQTKRNRPRWRKVRVLRRLRNSVFVHPDGDIFCTARLVVVAVEGERTERIIARERLKSQGATEGE